MSQQQLCPPITPQQITSAISGWNNATINERFSILSSLLNHRALYQLSTLTALSKMSALKTITEDNLTEELVNSINGYLERKF